MPKAGDREQSVTFRLAISSDTFIRYYQGMAHSVLVTATDGRSVSFPASLLRKFVNHDGVQGLFRLYYGTDGKVRRLEKVDHEPSSA
ncbi:MAG: DUF2835 domain-containing protein [Ectothiorhodospiraceae bacterium]|nr:DUF2835 domain-containing protein [Ectothiorhodospiraceae bacterium]MCH8505186.1 DUF2835 domain-containing protein [Ectothiorhodospiraceae bacterium]